MCDSACEFRIRIQLQKQHLMYTMSNIYKNLCMYICILTHSIKKNPTDGKWKWIDFVPNLRNKWLPEKCPNFGCQNMLPTQVVAEVVVGGCRSMLSRNIRQ